MNKTRAFELKNPRAYGANSTSAPDASIRLPQPHLDVPLAGSPYVRPIRQILVGYCYRAGPDWRGEQDVLAGGYDPEILTCPRFWDSAPTYQVSRPMFNPKFRPNR